MKSLKEIILMFAVVSGLALSIPAQNNDDQKRPPKPRPPVVDPKQKPPKGGGDRPKKPGMSYYPVSGEAGNLG